MHDDYTWHRHYPWRITSTDPELPHQIVLRFNGHGEILVSCNCLRRRYPQTGQWHYAPLGVRRLWQPGEAQQTWRDHMARVRGDGDG